MTTDEALEEADFISEGCGVSERTARATMTLANEVRRLRAGVEAVRALPRFDLDGGYDDPRVNCSDGLFMSADDVLAALPPLPAEVEP